MKPEQIPPTRQRHPDDPTGFSGRTQTHIMSSPAAMEIHHLAARCLHAARRITQDADTGRRDRDNAYLLALRGIRILRSDDSPGGRLISRLCEELKKSIDQLAHARTVIEGIPRLAKELSAALSRANDAEEKLDAAHRLAERLDAELRSERARAQAALSDIAQERWDEPTRNVMPFDDLSGGVGDLRSLP